MDIERFADMADEVMKDIENLRRRGCGCIYYPFDTNDGENTWAVVFGFSGGFTENEKDADYYRVCGKVAYQPGNSVMQCDYDTDWFMPYDAGTQEVYDTNTEIVTVDDVRHLFDEVWRMAFVIP